MCRNIKTLVNFLPPATDEEIRASALQFVRKVSGATRPSRANEAAFTRAVEEVTAAATANRKHTRPDASFNSDSASSTCIRRSGTCTRLVMAVNATGSVGDKIAPSANAIAKRT